MFTYAQITREYISLIYTRDVWRLLCAYYMQIHKTLNYVYMCYIIYRNDNKRVLSGYIL